MISYFLYQKVLAALEQEAKGASHSLSFYLLVKKLTTTHFAGYPFLFHSTD